MNGAVGWVEGQVWDLLVIGGGTAGLVGARTAASFGVSVQLVERERTGEDCLWTGCVPSKALLAAASAAANARNAGRLGVRAAIATIEPADSPETLRAAGVHVLHGSARFTGPDTAQVDVADTAAPRAGSGTTVRFRRALVATGSDPALPPIPGLADARPPSSPTVLTADTVLTAATVLTTDAVWNTTGFSRLVPDRRGRVIGATGAGPRAGGTAAELTLAVERWLRARDLAAIMHPYPTFADGPWIAASAHVRARLGSGPAHRVIAAIAGGRRRCTNRREVTES